MGRYPVTNREYGLFLEETGYHEPGYWTDRSYNQPDQPVVGVNWHNAKNFADWAGLALPSEAQWECACRAGTTTKYYTGDKEEDLDRAGWYYGNSGGRLHSVGEKEPNMFGLFDMHGNVWEWCNDDWHGDYKGTPQDGSPWINNPERLRSRVCRGGSWFFDSVECRSAHRHNSDPNYSNGHIGFRLAAFPPKKPRAIE